MHYTVLEDHTTPAPTQIQALMRHFAAMMQKKGAQVRVGVDGLSDVTLNGAVQEGISVEGCFTMIVPVMALEARGNQVLTDYARVHFEEFESMNIYQRNRLLGAIAQVAGLSGNEPSQLIIIWSKEEDHHPDMRIDYLRKAAAHFKTPIINLALKPHRDKIIAKVKKANTKSSVHNLISKRHTRR